MSDPRPRTCREYLKQESIAFPNLCAICAAGPCPYGKAKAEAARENPAKPTKAEERAA